MNPVQSNIPRFTMLSSGKYDLMAGAGMCGLAGYTAGDKKGILTGTAEGFGGYQGWGQ